MQGLEARHILLTTNIPTLVIELGVAGHVQNSPRHHCAGDAVVPSDFSRAGEHRYRASKRKHRDQPAGISAARGRARLPGLLRATTGSELFFLRRHVLAVRR